MHITILALGSYGDVLPFAVLGKGLRDAGYQVRLATFEDFGQMVESRGLEIFPIQGNAKSIMGGGAGLALAESGTNVLVGFKAIMESFGALADEYVRCFSDSRLWETELIINQLPVFGADLGDKLGVQYFTAGVIPLIRTKTFPLPLFPQWKLGCVYNALSYRLAEQLAWQGFRKVVNRWRRDVLGLPPKGFWGDFDRIYAETPVLAGFSQHVVPRAMDWSNEVHVTGYWLPEDNPSWQPPDDLHRFLDAGPPPVFIGFGSMPLRDPHRVTTMIVEALQRSGQRGILSAGWGELGDQDLPGSIMKIGYVPYTWLLPRTAGVAIHGGSGSTASALRAGVPTLIIPFVMDQFYWGNRVFELGVGPRPIPFKRLSVEALTCAFEKMVNDVEMSHKAALLGEAIHAEDGVASAISVIRQYT
jgi:UDP:flavonoid glycosyltransferase YjiC (YdhE family)